MDAPFAKNFAKTNPAANKAAQRKRRKAGFEEVRALVYMPDFLAWLVWDGWLSGEDVGEPAAIRAALADFVREQYRHIREENYDPPAQYANGSFGAEFTALRDRPKEVAGLLEREGAYDWREPPTRYLITRRNAVLRGIADNDQHTRPGRHKKVEITPLADPYDRRRWEGLEEYISDDDEPAPPPDDDDPDLDAEEASAELSDDAFAEHFDADGYEKIHWVILASYQMVALSGRTLQVPNARSHQAEGRAPCNLSRPHA